MNTFTLLVNEIILVSCAGLMVWAALSDIRSFIIPNRISIAILAIYPAHVLSAAGTVNWVGGLTVGACVLAIGFVFFVLNWTGAGDVKLLAATSVWAGPELIAPFLVVTALAGGALSIGVMLRTRFAKAGPTDGLADAPPFSALLQLHVPYGTAIAVGGLYVVLQRFAF